MSTIGKIFKAYDVRAVYPTLLDENAAWKVGYGAGQVIAAKAKDAQGVAQPNTVLVSRDMRPHSPVLAAALIEGLRAAGRDVIDVGMCDTSFIYFAVNHLGAAGGIQTTASHNPIEYNGFKISGPQARPIGADTGLKDIQAIAESCGDRGSVQPSGVLEKMDLWEEYREHILRFLSPLKRPVKVFIDASNGMAGKLIPQAFDDIPNLEIIELNFEITGSFVHPPNPLEAENMVPTQTGVREHGAAMGACFDGDADRCMLTDDTGAIIGCDHLTALLCDHFVPQAPGSTVVYDLRSSKVVEETILAHGAKPARSMVGHVHMKRVLRETDGIFGGELSGHFYFRDNFFTDSGAIAFAAMVSILGNSDKPLSELIAPFRKYPQSGEINFKVEDKQGVMDQLKAKYADAIIDDLDGVTIDHFDAKGWWFNVRASNTEPLLRLNVEARDQSTLDAILAEITPMLGEPDAGH
jgi:phosphomannomutase